MPLIAKSNVVARFIGQRDSPEILRPLPLRSTQGQGPQDDGPGDSSVRHLVIHILRYLLGADKEAESPLGLYPADRERFKDIISYHELGPFAYLAFKDSASRLPQELMELLKRDFRQASLRCECLWQEFLRISGAFEEAGVIILPIKGVALLRDIYTDRPVRPMIDIDLLVKEECLQEAEEIFCGLGYREDPAGLKHEYWRQSHCHITLCKERDNPLAGRLRTGYFNNVDLHWGLDFKRQGRNVLLELWERTREIKTDGRIIKVPSPEDTLFSLVLHARRFGNPYPLCLKNIFDIVLLLDKYASTFDWDYCLRQSRRYNISSALFFTLMQAELLLNLGLPGYVWEGLHLSPWRRGVIRQFIRKNVFSTKTMKDTRGLYLKSHFLLYDSLWEPIDYILNIPLEQFSKYYSLKPYTKKTNLLYKNRLLYIPFKTILNLANLTRLE